MSLQKLSLIDAFKWRHSTRKFAPTFTAPKQSAVEQVVEEIAGMKNPMGTSSSISLHQPGLCVGKSIKNEAGWIIGRTDPKSTNEKVFDAAFKAQIAVMRLAQHQIGTVWVAGNYNSKKAESSNPGYKVPFAIAYGSTREEEKIGKGWSRSVMKRKSIDKIFFDLKENCPLSEEAIRDNKDFFEAIRYGPSAINQQPWKFLITPDAIHLYDTRKLLKWLGPMDLGIAAANIVLLLKEQGIDPKITVEAIPLKSPLGGRYVCSISKK